MNRLRLTPIAALIVSGAAFGQTSASAQSCFAGSNRYDPPVDARLADDRNCNLPSVAPRPVGMRNANVGAIRVEIDRDGVPADGQSPVKVMVRLFDLKDQPLRGEAMVTIESSGGRVQLPGRSTDQHGPGRGDADRFAPGTQILVNDGVAEFLLLAPHEAQDVRLRMTAGGAEVVGRVSFVPDMREMIAIGVIEGLLDLRKLPSGSVQAAGQNDGFEQELRHIQRDFSNGKGTAGVSTNFFLKGKVLGSALLTMSYDSDKASRSRLFRDIRPEEFYPIYGDASIKGFDARSSEKFFVRIDRGKSYALYGDFTTAQISQSVSLGQYSRSLTGVKANVENEWGQLTAFGARDRLRQVVDEQPARGLSGPYLVSNLNGVRNSEKVELIVRDRNQPSVILEVRPQERFVDYTFEPFSGQVLFKSPVPTLDSNFNPITVRITYEVDDGGENFTIAGASGRVKIGDAVEVGGTFADDGNPANPYRLQSINAAARLGERTSVTAEVARSERDSIQRGDAGRVEVRHLGERLQARAFAGQTDKDFVNPAATMAGGRREAGGRATYALTDSTRVYAEGLSTEDRVTGGKRDGASAGVEHDVTPRLRVDVGVRHASSSGPAATPGQAGISNLALGQQYTPFQTSASQYAPAPQLLDTTSVRTRISARPVDGATAFAEYERDIADAERRRYGLGGDYRIAEQTRLYARHDWASSDSGAYGLGNTTTQSATVAGIDTQYMQNGQAFSEMRLRDGFSGQEASAAMGLRNTIPVAEGVRLLAGVERVKAFSGPQGDATALSGGWELFYNPQWRASGRIELRRDDLYDAVLSTLAWTRKLDRDWSFIARNYLNALFARTSANGDRLQNRAQLGLAYRQTDTSRWNALARYEHKTERDTGTATPLDRLVHVVSAHANYRPSRPWTFSGRVGGKHVTEDFGTGDSRYSAYILGGRAIYDINERWDVGALASVLYSPQGDSRQYAMGAEVGYLLAQNLWVAVGYNWTGFRDRDLAGSDYTNRGVFARLRFKFDEDLFRGRDPETNRTIDTAAR